MPRPAPPEPQHRVMVRLPESVHRQLQRQARASGRPIAIQIRDLVLAAFPPEPGREK